MGLTNIANKIGKARQVTGTGDKCQVTRDT